MIDWRFRSMTGKGVAAQYTESVTQSSKSKLWAPNWRIHDVIEKLLWPCPVLCWCTWLLTPFMHWSQRWRRAQIYAQSSIWKVAKKWEFSDNHFKRVQSTCHTPVHSLLEDHVHVHALYETESFYNSACALVLPHVHLYRLQKQVQQACVVSESESRNSGLYDGSVTAALPRTELCLFLHSVFVLYMYVNEYRLLSHTVSDDTSTTFKINNYL